MAEGRVIETGYGLWVVNYWYFLCQVGRLIKKKINNSFSIVVLIVNSIIKLQFHTDVDRAQVEQKSKIRYLPLHRPLQARVMNGGRKGKFFFFGE